jgi:hypothetical protein
MLVINHMLIGCTKDSLAGGPCRDNYRGILGGGAALEPAPRSIALALLSQLALGSGPPVAPRREIARRS